ncbi:hypothetical protein, partial [Devosia sp.]|uniref:hypothetical protein n=1 Tax=Devosia sp. TaxID=1871048 RepID=UPI002FC7563D
MERVELRNSRGPAWVLIVTVKLGAALLLGGVTVIALGRGVGLDRAWPAGLGALLVLAFGLFDLSQMLDRKVQLTLTPEGLLDHRMQPPLLLPWSAVSAMFQDSADGHTVSVTVQGLDTARYRGPGTARAPFSSATINIQLDHVEVS